MTAPAALTRAQLELLKADPILTSISQAPAPPSSCRPLHHLTQPQSASAILQSKSKKRRISSGSRALDALLSHEDEENPPGLMQGTLLELTGCPGEGKTRMCVSFAMRAALQAMKDNEAGPTVLIFDTQGSITPRLLYEAASACSEASAVQILDRIILWTCSAADDLLLALHRMPAFLDDNHGIQLVVIDSLSAPLSSYLVPSLSIKLVKEQDEKQDKSKNWRTSERTKKRRRSYFGNDNDVVARKIIQNTLNGLVRETLLEIVNSRLLSAIVTTQSKTKLTDEYGENASFRDAKHSFAVPAFANTWHIPNTIQLLLSATSRANRRATVTVSAEEGGRGRSASFRTCTSGIEDVSASQDR